MNNINDENLNFKIHNENPALNLILDENELALNSEVVSVDGNSTKKKNENQNNLIKNIFDIQNEFYEENLEFQDLRTQKMNEAEYLEYINCRIQGFLTRGKKLFLNYLQNIILAANLFKPTNKIVKEYSCENFQDHRNKNGNKSFTSNLNYNISNINDEELIENQKVENYCFGNSYYNQNEKNLNTSSIDNLYNVPYELKDQGNLELICFILKELLNKIVKNAIKNKNPEKRLLELKYPLNVEDIENFALEELDKLEQFLSDYSVSIYLMKDFKKKKFCKLNNKNVKIKKVKSSFYVIIKKYIFLETNKEADYFRKNRKSMEEKIAKNFKNLYSEYNKQCFDSKCKYSINNRNKNKKLNKNNKRSDLIILEEERILQKEIEKKYLLNYFNIQHYYEFYLLKDILKEVDEINYSVNYSKLKKINKKFFTKKFESWINMGEFERSFYKNEYKIILDVKDTENELF